MKKISVLALSFFLILSSKAFSNSCASVLSKSTISANKLIALEVLSAAYLSATRNMYIIHMRKKGHGVDDIPQDAKNWIVNTLKEELPKALATTQLLQTLSKNVITIEDLDMRNRDGNPPRLKHVVKELREQNLNFDLNIELSDSELSDFLQSNIDAIMMNAKNMKQKSLLIEALKLPETYYTPGLALLVQMLYTNEQYISLAILSYWLLGKAQGVFKNIFNYRAPLMRNSYDFDIGRDPRAEFIQKLEGL